MIPKQEHASEENKVRKIPAQPGSRPGFRTLYSLPIYTEQMDGLPLRTTLRYADVSKAKSALINLALPTFDNTDKELATFTEDVMNKWYRNSIDFLRINVEPGSIKVHHMSGVTKSPIAGQLLEYFHDIRSLTVVRRGANDEERMYDGLWDYLISRCIKDGIHWAYDPERPAKDAHGENTTFPEAVLKGLAKAPYNWWMPDGGARKAWPKKAGFTSMEDLRCRLIIALLQDFSRQKYAHDMLLRFDKTFLQHTAFVEKDTLLTVSPRHFDLLIMVANPSGRQLPELLSNTMMTIRRTTEDGGNSEDQSLQGRFIKTRKVSWLSPDFVLDVYLPEGCTSWGQELKREQNFKVHLEVHLDIAKAQEQLQDITNVCENATKELRDFFLGLSSHAEAAEENVDWEAIRKLLRNGNLGSGYISLPALKSVYRLTMEEIRQAELRARR